jgi:hypothetical protein
VTEPTPEKPPIEEMQFGPLIVWGLLIVALAIVVFALSNVGAEPYYGLGVEPSLAAVVDRRAAQIVDVLRVIAALLGICAFAGLKILFYKWPRV